MKNPLAEPGVGQVTRGYLVLLVRRISDDAGRHAQVSALFYGLISDLSIRFMRPMIVLLVSKMSKSSKNEKTRSRHP